MIDWWCWYDVHLRDRKNLRLNRGVDGSRGKIVLVIPLIPHTFKQSPCQRNGSFLNQWDYSYASVKKQKMRCTVVDSVRRITVLTGWSRTSATQGTPVTVCSRPMETSHWYSCLLRSISPTHLGLIALAAHEHEIHSLMQKRMTSMRMHIRPDLYPHCATASHWSDKVHSFIISLGSRYSWSFIRRNTSLRCLEELVRNSISHGMLW